MGVPVANKIFYRYDQLVALLGEPGHPISPDPVRSGGTDRATYPSLFRLLDEGALAA